MKALGFIATILILLSFVIGVKGVVILVILAVFLALGLAAWVFSKIGVLAIQGLWKLFLFLMLLLMLIAKLG